MAVVIITMDWDVKYNLINYSEVTTVEKQVGRTREDNSLQLQRTF